MYTQTVTNWYQTQRYQDQVDYWTKVFNEETNMGYRKFFIVVDPNNRIHGQFCSFVDAQREAAKQCERTEREYRVYEKRGQYQPKKVRVTAEWTNA